MTVPTPNSRPALVGSASLAYFCVVAVGRISSDREYVRASAISSAKAKRQKIGLHIIINVLRAEAPRLSGCHVGDQFSCCKTHVPHRSQAVASRHATIARRIQWVFDCSISETCS